MPLSRHVTQLPRCSANTENDPNRESMRNDGNAEEEERTSLSSSRKTTGHSIDGAKGTQLHTTFAIDFDHKL